MKSLWIKIKIFCAKETHPLYHVFVLFISVLLLFFALSILDFKRGKDLSLNPTMSEKELTVERMKMDSLAMTVSELEEKAQQDYDKNIPSLGIENLIVSQEFAYAGEVGTDTVAPLDAYFSDPSFDWTKLGKMESKEQRTPENVDCIIYTQGGGRELKTFDQLCKTYGLSYTKDEIVTEKQDGVVLSPLAPKPGDLPFALFNLRSEKVRKLSVEPGEIYFKLNLSRKLTDTELLRVSAVAGFSHSYGVPTFDDMIHPLLDYLSFYLPLRSIERLALFFILLVDFGILFVNTNASLLSFRKNLLFYQSQKKLGVNDGVIILNTSGSHLFFSLVGLLLGYVAYFIFNAILKSNMGFMVLQAAWYGLLLFVPVALIFLIESLVISKSLNVVERKKEA